MVSGAASVKFDKKKALRSTVDAASVDSKAQFGESTLRYPSGISMGRMGNTVTTAGRHEHENLLSSEIGVSVTQADQAARKVKVDVGVNQEATDLSISNSTQGQQMFTFMSNRY